MNKTLLEAASHALRSYQYGNGATDLAKDLADKIDAALAAPAGKPDQFQSLRDALVAYVKAQGRMLDKWADGDDNVKRDLWTNLHACEEPAREALAAPAGEPAAVIERLRLQHAGDMLSNCAFNLAQSSALDDPVRKVLDGCRREWDAARNALRAPAPAGESPPADEEITGDGTGEALPPIIEEEGLNPPMRTCEAKPLKAANLSAALRAIVRECRGPDKPYSTDSYLPPHLLELASAALESTETPLQVIEAMRHDEELS